MVVSIEQHVDWITDCLGYLENRELDRIEASAEAEDAWGRRVNELANATLYPRAASWYVGANIPGKPRVFMPYVGGCGTYRRECEEVVERGYKGFILGAEACRLPARPQAAARDHWADLASTGVGQERAKPVE
jgi:cyclohexanone monooxygenase